jgi:hypothetical protein
MTCMHPYLMWNIGPPLWWSIVIGCLCLHSKALLVLSMHWLIHVLVIHSVVSAVPILGCLRRLLLLLFIKLDSVPKCGVAWFIMKDFLFWIVLRIILWSIVCIMPSPIKIVNQSWTCLKLKQYSSSICCHQSSWKSSSRPDMPLIACSERLIIVCSMFFLMDSSQLVKSDSGKKCLDIINDVHVITHIHTVKCAFELQNRWSHSQSWWCASFWHSFQCNDAITFVIAMFQRVTPRWRYEVVP